MSSLVPPGPGWWRPFPRDEKLWLGLAVVAALVMSAIALGWTVAGAQNVPVKSYRSTPEEFEKRLQEFQSQFQVQPGVVRVPPGQDAYIMARMWSFTPQLILKRGQTYTIWLSSRDALHGFSIAGQNLNVMAVPGHAYGVRLTPTKAGEYLVVCNEYCGVGHQAMTGKIVVED